MPEQPSPKPRHHKVRLTLRVLMLMLLATGAGMGWLVHEARTQRAAVAAIEKARGHVTYHWQWIDEDHTTRGEAGQVSGLAKLIGVDYFGYVNAVDVGQATDATMAQAGRLSRIEELRARGAAISDAGLEHLKNLTNLARLNLSGTPITSAGMVYLAVEEMTELKHLDLSNTRVTDRGLMRLKELTGLRVLDARIPGVTDAATNTLKLALPNLTIRR
jgi:hypothetical protein